MIYESEIDPMSSKATAVHRFLTGLWFCISGRASFGRDAESKLLLPYYPAHSTVPGAISSLDWRVNKVVLTARRL